MVSIFKRKSGLDLTTGSIFKKLIIFAFPLMCTGILQLLFHSADIAVLKAMVNQQAVAAVGATSVLINLFINFSNGFSIGASILLSKSVGAKDSEKAKRIVGTAILLSLISGIVIMVIGLIFSKTFLVWIDCPDELINQANIYLQIYFVGMPIILFYNFSAGLLRAVGDSVRPLIYLICASFVNIGLNVFLIAVFNMTVEGVAIGTVGSKLVASILVFRAIRKSDGYAKFEFKFCKIFKKEVKEIISIGLPSGLQNSLFNLSNLFISSTVNSYGPDAIAGSTAAQQLDILAGQIGASLASAEMSFVAQNLGAKNMKRIKKVVSISTLTIFVSVFTVSLLNLLLAKPLTSIFIDTQQAFEFAKIKIIFMGLPYFLKGIIDALSNTMRALGKSTLSMFITLFFLCIFRIVWIKAIYIFNPTFEMIYYCYPISWILCLVVEIIALIPLIKKTEKQLQQATA